LQVERLVGRGATADQTGHGCCDDNVPRLPHRMDSVPRWCRSFAKTVEPASRYPVASLRGSCLRAQQDGFDQLEIYRAKQVYSPRAMSEMRVGTTADPSRFLRDLRTHIGVETALGLPAPNSGLSARLPSS